MSDPRTEGARAYRSGEDREDNPYDRVSETEDYYEWLDGFNESEFSGSADDE